jgi:hypothetical protein
MAAFQQAQALAAREKGDLWGRSLVGPLLLVMPGTRQVVASQQDAQGRLKPQDGVFTGTLPESVPLTEGALDWSGTLWALLPWPLQAHGESRSRQLLHASFHRLMEERGLRIPPGPPPTHLATLEGRFWLQLEWRALESALLASGFRQYRYVGDALVFRAQRRKACPGAAAAERPLELREGLAEYTAIRAHAFSTDQILVDALAGLRAAALEEDFSESFARVSGPCYGLLLDARKSNWRKALDADSDLGDLLAQAYTLHVSKDPGPDVMQRGEPYGGAVLRADEVRRAGR